MSLDLNALPLLAFSARVSEGRLEILQAQGGLFKPFNAAIAPEIWLDSAIDPEQRAAFMAPLTAESGQLIRLHTADGTWRWFNLRIGEIRYEGPDLYYTALLTDATDFKAMREEAQRYRSYTEIASDWYWEMDDAYRFSYFSREFEEITGVPSSNALDNTRWDGLGKERLGNVDWAAHQALMFEHQPFRNFEYPSRRPDGCLVWVRVSGRPGYDENGKFIGYHGIASDISAIRQMEDRLQQSERLASIGQLAAGVAHEINNPVGFIRSNLGTLSHYLNQLSNLVECYAAIESSCPPSENLSALMAEKKKVDLKFLREDAPVLVDESRNGLDRVKKIVADLLEFSRDGHRDWSDAEIEHCMDSAINLVAITLPKKIELKRQLSPLPPLRCKPLQLNQVFFAILANAIQAIGEQSGCITISSGQNANAEQWIEISDTGCGIVNEDLLRIFEPFFTTRPVGMGTGMGLAMSYGIIAEHEGRIEVQSTASAGTSFRITFPPSANAL